MTTFIFPLVGFLAHDRFDGMSYSARIKELFKKYGRIGVGVHLGVYATTLTGFYIGAEKNSKLEEFLVRHGLLSDKDIENDAIPQKRGWVTERLTSSGSSLALAFLCTKATLPLRVPFTVAITPSIAKLLRSHTVARAARQAESQVHPK